MNISNYNPPVNTHNLSEHRHDQSSMQNTQHSRDIQRPGDGSIFINKQRVELTAMNTSGFVSSFRTSVERRMMHRNKLVIPVRYAERLLKGEIKDIAKSASQDMYEIATKQLNRTSEKYQQIQQKALDHLAGFSEDDITNIYNALLTYQDVYGDNFLMNVASMGYKKLESYLCAQDEKYNDPKEIEDFLHEFNEHYEDNIIMDNLGLQYSRGRLENEISDKAKILDHFLHTAPRLNDIPLLKGAAGLNNSLSTQVDGKLMVNSLLQGKGLHFNGFLSTTSSYEIARRFCSSELGRPIYSIDLMDTSDESEVLRRDILHALESPDGKIENILYSFKATNVAGISMRALKNVIRSEGINKSLDAEDEILLAPGHYLIPEKIVRLQYGVAITGSLAYGRE
ncbi:hypothetical protein [Kosakonia sp. MUSA4]|uniref:hypothetical protein n=1 Tax=Kosakonia sp. MUSA4 TaxID=2067958 RepID=UPI001ABEF3D6|nr:hypothetical protein [Kosakonia sp. MUSA4]